MKAKLWALIALVIGLTGWLLILGQALHRSEVGEGAIHQALQDEVEALKDAGREQTVAIMRYRAQVVALETRLATQEQRRTWDEALHVAVLDHARVGR